MSVFVVDSSSWISLHEEHHPPDVFPTLWTELKSRAESGAIKVPTEVFREVGEDQGIGAWLRMLVPPVVCKPSAGVQGIVGDVMRNHPSLVHGRRASADPWIIAFAQSNRWVAVTEEQIGSPARPTIRGICTLRGVECIRAVEMLRRLEIRI